jgi:hypothetical protein
MSVGGHMDMPIVMALSRAMIGKNKKFVTSIYQGLREFLRKGPYAALHRWIFACNLSYSHV